MSRPLMSIVQGWTGALPFTLLADGEPQDLSSMTVQIVLKNAHGVTVKDTSAGIDVTVSTAGRLEYAPSSSSGDLFVARSSPYRIRFRVTDGLQKTAYFPNDEEDLIEVNPQ